jgi:hypothetical protein
MKCPLCEDSGGFAKTTPKSHGTANMLADAVRPACRAVKWKSAGSKHSFWLQPSRPWREDQMRHAIGELRQIFEAPS